MDLKKACSLSLCVFSSISSIAYSVENSELGEARTRSDALPKERFSQVQLDDRYLEGYIQALLDMHYHEFKVLVTVRNQKATLFNLPANGNLTNTIIQFVSDIPEIKGVDTQKVENIPPKELYKEQQEAVLANQERINGVWWPQTSVLFAPMLANPRKICYSAGHRWNDRVISKRVAAISLGDEWAFFRWHNVGKYNGDMQLGLDAGLWGVFDLKTDRGDWGDLMNTDYYVGFPLTYAYDKWSYRARLYHVSCHIGDEAIVSKKIKDRKNPSFEAVDLFASYQFNDHLRLYGGGGYIFRSDGGYKLKPLYVEYGAELRPIGQKNTYHQLYIQPFIAAHLSHTQDHRWNPDFTAVAGYEWSKIHGIGKKFRAFFEYHKGYSAEGQFSRQKSQYFSFNISYGF